MNLLKHTFLTLTLLVLGFTASAQQQTAIKGIVMDAKHHHPVAGIMIMSKDSSTHAITDSAGRFEIKPDKMKGAFWVFGLGYQTRVVKYDKNTPQLNIGLIPNTQMLNEIKISAFGPYKSIKQTPGAVAVLSGSQLNQGSGVSMQTALNSIPGVRMDKSNLGDSRISIRGNGIRSPWGIRNVKIYVNNIPLTEADGTSRIEALNVSDLGQATIIKGPASSLYGAGTGGVIKFRLKQSPYEEQSMTASGLVGSYGLYRYGAAYRGNTDKMNSCVSYGRQGYEGYREHSSDYRRFIAGNFQLFPSDRRVVTLLVSHTAEDAQIPGALTKSQMEENPRQADPTNVDKQAGRHQKWTRIGINQRYEFNNHFHNSTSIFTYFYKLNHPLPFGIINNTYQSYGTRTAFDYDAPFKVLPTTFTFGAEFNHAFSKGSIYANNHGETGDMNSNTNYTNYLLTLFLQTETKLWHWGSLELGLSYNSVRYNATDFLYPERGGIKKFKPQLSPRIALSHDFGSWLTLHGSISSGFSAPTTTQITNKNLSINKNLQAEKGINYEIDAKGNFFDSRLSYNLALFRMNMKGELIAQAITPGLTVYHNSGKTVHNGIELALGYQAIRPMDGYQVTKFRPYLSVTYSDFRFTDYKILNANNEIIADYDGNELTGIAPWVISAGFNLETKLGFYGNANYYFTDRQPLADDNSAFNPSYGILDAKLGYKKQLGTHFGLDIYGGLNNITNSHYSSFTELNAPSYGGQPPAYFNPSPAINGYVGLDFKYFITAKN